MEVHLSKSLSRVIPRLNQLLDQLKRGTPEEKRRAEKELRFAERYGHDPRRVHVDREELVPFIGQQVVVHLTRDSLEKLQRWDGQAAERFTARVGRLSDVGEVRAFFDLHGRPEIGWDVPIKCISRVTRC